MTQTTTDKETITKAREMTIDCWTGREESHHTQNIYLKVFPCCFVLLKWTESGIGITDHSANMVLSNGELVVVRSILWLENDVRWIFGYSDDNNPKATPAP